MAEQDFKRKLTAILSADVEGYSLLMRDDEEATIRTLTTYRKAITNLVQQYRGRLVDATGDNLLSEFTSVVDTVNCAVEIQRELAERNAELPEDRRMKFRIGINLGDVVEEGERIYGNGVNIAARMEGLAEGGGICISGTVYDAIESKIGLEYEYLGEQEVKNIPKPIRAYRVLSFPGAAAHRVIKAKKAVGKTWRNVIVAVAAVLIVVAALAIWNFYLRPTPPVEVASIEKMAYPLPDKPSIAVLPFENRSDDPKQEYFADGITDDLITDLSKISGVFVIASNSVFTYKGKPVKVQQVSEELGVRYVLEGSVRKAGDQIRINAQLIDATTGHHLWAERFDGKLKDIFALQDRFTQKIVAALAVELTANDASLLARRYTDNVAANEAYWQGWEHQRRNTRDDLVKAVEYLKKAIELDPDFAQAHARLASAYQHIVRRRWEVDLGWKEARSLARKHLKIAMENPTPLALSTSALSRVFRRQYEEAIDEAERAIALDPNDADNLFRMGYVLTYAGRSAEAIDFFKTAMRLNPHYPSWYKLFLGVAQYCLEQYNEAAASEERALKLDPNASTWWLAAAYAQLGREEEAADVLAEYQKKRKFSHGTSVENTFKYWPFKDPIDLERFADGLLKAGLPRPWNPVYRRHYEEALAEAERALSMNPDNAEAQLTMGETLLLVGRSSEAVSFITKAMELNPNYPPFYLHLLALAHFCLERYDQALVSNKTYHQRNPYGTKWLLVATYAHLGREQEASEVLQNYMKKRKYKGYTVQRVLKYQNYAFKDPKDTERFAEGLHKAGLPME